MADILKRRDLVGHLCLVRRPCHNLNVSKFRSDENHCFVTPACTSTMPIPILPLPLAYC